MVHFLHLSIGYVFVILYREERRQQLFIVFMTLSRVFFVCRGTVYVPYCDAVCQKASYRAKVKGHQQLFIQVALSQRSQVVYKLLCL